MKKILTRTLSQHLSDFGITFEALQSNLCATQGYTLNFAATVIVAAWQEGELDALLWEAGEGLQSR